MALRTKAGGHTGIPGSGPGQALRVVSDVRDATRGTASAPTGGAPPHYPAGSPIGRPCRPRWWVITTAPLGCYPLGTCTRLGQPGRTEHRRRAWSTRSAWATSSPTPAVLAHAEPQALAPRTAGERSHAACLGGCDVGCPCNWRRRGRWACDPTPCPRWGRLACHLASQGCPPLAVPRVLCNPLRTKPAKPVRPPGTGFAFSSRRDRPQDRERARDGLQEPRGRWVHG